MLPEPTLAAHTDNAIDQYAEALAEFCFEQLEKTVSTRDTNDGVDEGIDLATLEDEFKVQGISAV